LAETRLRVGEIENIDLLKRSKGAPMRKETLVLLLVLACAAVCSAGDLLFFIPNGQKTTATDYVVPTLDAPTTGHKTATILSVPVASAVRIPTLPAGTKKYRIWVHTNTSGINIGPLTVASGSTYPSLASATLHGPYPVATTTPSTYLVGTSAVATATILPE
jgi:hypothetical protein